MTTADPNDGWTAADAYEAFMGRWSRPLAPVFLEWFDPPAGGHWLDIGTGTGALASAICAMADPASVVGCDPSPAFVAAAARGSSDSRATFVVAGVGNLPRREGGYDAIVTGLALNFFPDPAAGVAEALSALRVGGLLGAYVWDYAHGMQLLRHFWDAAVATDAGAIPLDEGRRFPLCAPAQLETFFRWSGAERVRVGALTIRPHFADFEDYWHPFTLGAGPAPSYVMGLDCEQQGRLRAELAGRLPVRPDGSNRLDARAWAVSGARGAAPLPPHR